jgi:hypothetical protein
MIIIISEWLSSLHDYHFSVIIIIISIWLTSLCDHVHHHQLIILPEWLSSLHDYHFSVIMIIIISKWLSSLHDYHFSVIIIIIYIWSTSPCDHVNHHVISYLNGYHLCMITISVWLLSLPLHDQYLCVIMLIIKWSSHLNDHHLCMIIIPVWSWLPSSDYHHGHHPCMITILAWSSLSHDHHHCLIRTSSPPDHDYLIIMIMIMIIISAWLSFQIDLWTADLYFSPFCDKKNWETHNYSRLQNNSANVIISRGGSKVGASWRPGTPSVHWKIKVVW